MAAAAPLEIRPMQDRDWPAVADLVVAAFGGVLPWAETYRRRMGDGAFRVAVLDGEVVGTLSVYRMAQLWGGRAVPMGGVAGVAVAPEARGRGVASQLVEQTLIELKAEGIPLSCLYASTQHVYRSVGYEQAGNRVTWSLPLAGIGVSDRTLAARRVEGEGSLLPWVRPEPGNLIRNPAMWDRLLRPAQGEVRCWAFGDEGYAVIMTPHDQQTELHVRDFCLHTPAALRRFLTLLADHRSIVQTVKWPGPSDEPLLLLLPEASWKAERVERWMMRITDVEASLRLRGWPVEARGELHVEVEDPLFPTNAGRFLLRVDGGAATVERGGRGDLQVPIGSLAPLYSGLLGAEALAGLGLLAGTESAIQTAGRLFAGPEPFMRDAF